MYIVYEWHDSDHLRANRRDNNRGASNNCGPGHNSGSSYNNNRGGLNNNSFTRQLQVWKGAAGHEDCGRGRDRGQSLNQCNEICFPFS